MSLKLVKRSNSPNWHIRGTIRGIRIEESTGTDDRRWAEEIRVKRESEILTRSVYGRAASATFAEAALSYLEQGGSRRFFEPVLRHFGTTALSKIDQGAIEAAAIKLYPDASPPTRNRQVFTPVLAVLHHAARSGLCSAPVVKRPKPKPGRVRWLTAEETDLLIAKCSDHLRPLVTFLLYTGARCSEALWLDWRQVELARAHVSFPKSKNGEARGIPLHPRLVAALANLPHREGEVFRKGDGLPYARLKGADDTSAGTRIKTAFRAACRRAGIADFHPHDCRHSWASAHYAANRDLGALQKLGGWRTVTMVMRYAHTNVAELAKTIDRLPGGKISGKRAARKAKNA